MSLQAGDRVACYGTKPGNQVGRIYGMVLVVYGDKIDVQTDTGVFSFHIKTLRKLVKRERKEIYINEYKHRLGNNYYKTKEAAYNLKYDADGFIRTIRFVEAKDQK